MARKDNLPVFFVNVSILLMLTSSFLLVCVSLGACSKETSGGEITSVIQNGGDAIIESKDSLILAAFPTVFKVMPGEEFWIHFVLLNPTEQDLPLTPPPGGIAVTIIVTDEESIEYSNALAGGGGSAIIPSKSFTSWSVMPSRTCDDSKGNLAFQKPGKYLVKGVVGAGRENIVDGVIHVPSVYSNVVTVHVSK